MSDRTFYVLPKEYRLIVRRYDAEQWLEGSPRRNARHAARYFFLQDDRRYVRWHFATGKYTTVMERDGEPMLDQAKW